MAREEATDAWVAPRPARNSASRDREGAVNAFGADHIILPPDMRFFEDDERNFTAYKVATAHGAGRIEFGTYEFSLGDIPETLARLRARYAPEAR